MMVEGRYAGTRFGAAMNMRREPRVRVEALARDDLMSGRIQAVVIEQDTALVLNGSDSIVYSQQSIEKLIVAMQRQRCAQQGMVLEVGTSPRQFLAVIHDLDQTPSWSEQAVSIALQRIFSQADARGVTGIAMPLLGTVHGRLPKHRALELLDAAIRHYRGDVVERIWVLGG